MIGWVALGLAAWALARRDQAAQQRAHHDHVPGHKRHEAKQLPPAPPRLACCGAAAVRVPVHVPGCQQLPVGLR